MDTMHALLSDTVKFPLLFLVQPHRAVTCSAAVGEGRSG